MSKTKDESVARLAASRIVPRHFYFEGESLKKLQDELEEHGVEDTRLLIFPGLDDDGTPDLWLQVENVKTKDCGECINVSHTCPPDCGPP